MHKCRSSQRRSSTRRRHSRSSATAAAAAHSSLHPRLRSIQVGRRTRARAPEEGGGASPLPHAPHACGSRRGHCMTRDAFNVCCFPVVLKKVPGDFLSKFLFLVPCCFITVAVIASQAFCSHNQHGLHSSISFLISPPLH